MCSKNVLICRIVIIIVVAILPKTIVHVWFGGGLNVCSILHVVFVDIFIVGRPIKKKIGPVKAAQVYNIGGTMTVTN